MATISNMLGTKGGIGGTGIQPERSDISMPTSLVDIDRQRVQQEQAQQRQKEFVEATARSNGLDNQSAVFNQLQGVANGTGPNPAQAMLANSTGANVANQAALMAGQRGASANAGLLARQAAMQGANIQQDAAGQGAALQANQSLGALNQMGGVAGQQVGQQQAALTGYNNAALTGQQNLFGAMQGVNNAAVSDTASANGVRGAGISGAYGVQKSGADMVGGVMQSSGKVASMMSDENAKKDIHSGDQSIQNFLDAASAHAYKYKDPANGTGEHYSPMAQELEQTPVGKSMVMDTPEGKVVDYAKGFGALLAAQAHLNERLNQLQGKQPQKMAEGGGVAPAPQFHEFLAQRFAGGGQVQALVSPGEKYLSPDAVRKVESGANPMQVGETIPGKPKVGGAKNSYANDTVPKTLKEGGIVLPRSVTQSKDPAQAANSFVAAISAKHGKSLPRKGKQ